MTSSLSPVNEDITDTHLYIHLAQLHLLVTNTDYTTQSLLNINQLPNKVSIVITIIIISRQLCQHTLHCDLVITLMTGAKRKERYNEMSIITK